MILIFLILSLHLLDVLQQWSEIFVSEPVGENQSFRLKRFA